MQSNTLDAKQRFELLLKHIELPTEMVEQHFIDVHLEKVIVSEKQSQWKIVLCSKTLLPATCFASFLSHARSKFKHISAIELCVQHQPNISGAQLFEEYWDLCLEDIKQKHPLINGFLNQASITIRDFEVELGLIDGVNVEIANAKQMNHWIQAFYSDYLNTEYRIRFGLNEQRTEMLEKFKMQVEQEQQQFVEDAMAQQATTSMPTTIADADLKLMLGVEIKDLPVSIQTITEEERKVTVQGLVFDLKETTTKNGTTIFQFNITDFSDSIGVKSFIKNKEDLKIMRMLKDGMWILLRGKVEYDRFGNQNQPPELIFIPNDLVRIEPLDRREDTAEQKRVEFHLHSTMSTMDACASIDEYMALAKSWGHRAIALTDHAGVQAFPEAQKAAKKHDLKMIYGLEANVLNEPMPVVLQAKSIPMLEETYVIFDIETTSLSVSNGEIIELAGVKMLRGEIVDTFSTLVKPTKPIPEKITSITNITDQMVSDSPTIEQVLPEFLAFIDHCTLVAHNARFDTGFIFEWCKRLDLAVPTQAIVDTLEMSRLLLAKEMKQFNLEALTDKFKIELKSHHRALDDCTATGHVFFHLVAIANKRNVSNLQELNLQSDDRLMQVRPFHCTIYALNRTGLKNLYKLVSLSHTEFFKRVPCIPKRQLIAHREGLLIASGCEKGEFFENVLNKSIEEAELVAQFYDVLEVQPLTTYRHLVDKGIVNVQADIIKAIERIVAIGKRLDKPVIATGNVHYLHPRDKINRDIVIQGIAGYSPLKEMEKPEVHFRTTDEMLKEFSFLGEETAYDIVVTQTNILADRFESFALFPKQLFAPHIEGAETEIRETCYETAKTMYGDPLPEIIIQRLEKELVPIINYGFSANYLISQRLVKKSNENGYLVGSRGSVGSSIVAMMLGISEVNPLPPHYLCGSCKVSEWFTDGSVANGFDLVDKVCSSCGQMMKGHGHDIPFETFLGFKGDKVPDIDLNFSGEYQATAHNYTRILFGEKNCFRAGTVGTIKDKTAFGFVKKYTEEKGLTWRNAEVIRHAIGCTGVKRSTGQHPGGIIVVPDTIEIEEITPVQYPADSVTAEWKTTHFDYHAFEENLLKLDILGHDDPTMMHMLQHLTGVDPLSIPMNDPKVMSLFSSTEPLGVSPEQIRSNIGTYGIPEMGTKFVRQMLEETNPTSFSDLLQISGLSHGTDVWLGNAQELIRNRTCTIKTVIGCRDEIMLYLIYKAGMDASLAFTITESVRKGRGLKPEWIEEMKTHKVPQWYIDSCLKIKYMFPKAHAAAYVISAVRCAYYKIYHPLEFYASYFSIRAKDLDLQTMIKGHSAILKRYDEMMAVYNQLSKTDQDICSAFEMGLEMTSRGFSFQNIDINRSKAFQFQISGKLLIPPFSAVSGCGETAAQSMENAQKQGEFLSIDDFQSRTRCTKTIIDTLKGMGCFGELPDSNQLTLF
jgi:DNA polymerase-3 subunit alpha (Gram-positive type)